MSDIISVNFSTKLSEMLGAGFFKAELNMKFRLIWEGQRTQQGDFSNQSQDYVITTVSFQALSLDVNEHSLSKKSPTNVNSNSGFWKKSFQIMSF